MIALTCVSVLVLVVPRQIRPLADARVDLSTGAVRQRITIVAPGERTSLSQSAVAQTVEFAPSPLQGRRLTQRLTLALPISSMACRRLARRLGLRCIRNHLAAHANPYVAVIGGRFESAYLTTGRSQGATIDSTGIQFIALTVQAPRVRATVDCISPAPLRVLLGGRSVSMPCDSGYASQRDPRRRLELDAPYRGGAPVYRFETVKSMRLATRGAGETIRASNPEVAIDQRPASLSDGASGGVRLNAPHGSRNPFTLDLALGAENLVATSDNVASARVISTGAELIPSAWRTANAWWLFLLGVCVGAMVSLLADTYVDARQ